MITDKHETVLNYILSLNNFLIMLREINYKNGNSPLETKSFNLAVRIVKLSQYLTKDKEEFTMSKQVLRSGTNPGAMIHESFNAESDADYIHKLAIGLKEVVETQFWLKLLYHTEYLNEAEFTSIFADTVEVGKMLTSAIKTKKKLSHKSNISHFIHFIIILFSTLNYHLSVIIYHLLILIS